MTDISGVVPAIGKALAKRGYSELTPVQLSMLDPALVTSDALVSAQTGSGKTVAFGLALAPTLLGDANASDRQAHLWHWSSRRPANWPCRSPANSNGSMN
jgi:ATP-dependent RNA helicase DeaD